ncbi:MAG: hypothetical protein WAM60_03195 [Candidatus Promineifilaceae bacterium]
MRFIIREQPYEKPVATGLLRYEQDGRATGAVEHWRLTNAAEGYRFFRVDLDARDASGDSYLYHLVLSPENKPERLKFRFFNARKMISGSLLIEDTTMTLIRDANDQHFEETAEVDDQTLFWYPSTMGLGLLAYGFSGDDLFSSPAPTGTFPAVTLDKAADFAFERVNVTLEIGEKEKLVVAQQDVAVRPFSIRWQDQSRTLWLNPHKRPVKMVRGDRLTAVEMRHIHY